MFETGDYVVSVNNGICKVEDVVWLRLSAVSKKQEYFLLVPLAEKTAKLYIPMDGKSHGLRLVMDEAEARNIIETFPVIDEMEIEDEKLREQIYKDTIQSSDPENLARMMKCVLKRKREREEHGKKGTAIDERYYQIAAKNLSAEIAFALGKNTDEIQKIFDESPEVVPL